MASIQETHRGEPHQMPFIVEGESWTVRRSVREQKMQEEDGKFHLPIEPEDQKRQ